MKFLEIAKMLNQKHQGKIVLIKLGIFYEAIGRSALALGSLLPLKRICMSYGICKVGIPVGSIGEYLEELSEMSVPVVVYEYLTYSNLMEAHRLTAVGKTKKKDVILFNLKKEEYINWLLEELKTGRYKHSAYKTFYIYEPKKRKIQSARYIDRIVHRWYVESFMKEYIIKQFISTSYACIQGRGMHKACVAVQKGMKHCKRIYGEYYIIKMDVLKYFQNINKNILYNLLSKKITDKKVLWLTKEIIYSTEGELSIPLGNYTSQVFANYYLHQYDIYAKETLKCKWYYRYMDDAVILVKDKTTAIDILEKSRLFLREKLGLELNKKTQIFKSKQGVNFCGYKINENRMKIRDKGKRNLKKYVQKYDRWRNREKFL